MKNRWNIIKELKNFLILWTGQSVSQLGSEMTAFALKVWAFQKTGTAMSVVLLTVCHMLPGVVVGVLIGPFIDQHSKKKVMLLSDTAAALVSVAVLLLAITDELQISHLYLINALYGICGSIQSPASSVAVSVCVPKKHYLRISGLQSFAGSLLGIVSPVCATAMFAFGGLKTVLMVDLASFFFGVISLCLTKIPSIHTKVAEIRFRDALHDGNVFLLKNKGIRILIDYHMLINLVAGIAYFSVLTPMILARTGNNEMILGSVNSCIGIGMMLGAFFVMMLPKPKCNGNDLYDYFTDRNHSECIHYRKSCGV